MKSKLLVIIGLSMIALAAILWASQRLSPVSNSSQMSHPQSHAGSPRTSAGRVPAFYETAPSTLPPTLPPDKFTGKTFEAYKAVREIPFTIAQLPCYCYCDEEHGHKSLHSCYESEHAGSCAVCVDEVLLAYRLEKEKRLSPSEIRKRIIEMYSANN